MSRTYEFMATYGNIAGWFKLSRGLKAPAGQQIHCHRFTPHRKTALWKKVYNMKKVELPVKKIIEGKPVLNKDTLGNPEALDYYVEIPELQED